MLFRCATLIENTLTLEKEPIENPLLLIRFQQWNFPMKVSGKFTVIVNKYGIKGRGID